MTNSQNQPLPRFSPRSSRFLFLFATAGWILPISVRAEAFKEAVVTRTHEKVSVEKSGSAAHTAAVGEKLTAVTTVTTGEGARAELKFPDESLARLGASTRFTIAGDGRNLDLNQGVMLLQVPKQLGGAKVRTAAVTAAITGTTVLLEYSPKKMIKLIVVEGEVNLYRNEAPGSFRRLVAGEMLLMKPDAKTLPRPVEVDLKRLLKSSKLIQRGDDAELPNRRQMASAVESQQKQMASGELVPTPLVIPGRGATVLVETSQSTQVVADSKAQPVPPSAPVAPAPAPATAPLPVVAPVVITPVVPEVIYPGTISAPAFMALNSHSTLSLTSQPTINWSNPPSSGQVLGTRYEGAESISMAAFGVADATSPATLAGASPTNPAVLFGFSQLTVNGTPKGFATLKAPLILASQGALSVVSTPTSGVLPAPRVVRVVANPNPMGGGEPLGSIVTLGNIALYSQAAGISIGSGSKVESKSGGIELVAPKGRLLLSGTVTSNSRDLLANARNMALSGAQLSAYNVNLLSNSEITTNSTAASPAVPTVVKAQKRIELTSATAINIDDSTQLQVLAAKTSGSLRLNAGTSLKVTKSELSANNIDLNASTGMTLDGATMTADVLKATVTGVNGEMLIGNSRLTANTIMRLFAEGSNGAVRFVGNTVLTGSDIRIAGKTVAILNGVNVEIPKGKAALQVFTDSALFNQPNQGNFTEGGAAIGSVTTKPFSQRK